MDTTMTDTLKHEEALFIPSEDTGHEEYVPKVAGDYHGHITDARTLTREFKKDGRTFKARIFNILWCNMYFKIKYTCLECSSIFFKLPCN